MINYEVTLSRDVATSPVRPENQTACAAMCTCAHTPTSEGSVGMVTFDNQNVLFIKQVPPVFSCQREEMGGFYDLFLHLVWCLPHNKLPVVGS